MMRAVVFGLMMISAVANAGGIDRVIAPPAGFPRKISA